MFTLFLSCIILLSFTACGDTITINVYTGGDKDEDNNSSSETFNNSNQTNNNIIQDLNNTDSRVIKSLKGIELYEANLKQVEGTRRYDIEKFDGITSAFTPLYFDFDVQNFNPRNQDQEILVDGQRNSFSNIQYKLNVRGQLIASVNEKDIYSLELLSSKNIKETRVEAYHSDIDIEGVAYTLQIDYLSNFYIIEKLVSSDALSTIDEFTEKYKLKVFRGDYFRGLVFAEDNKLKEKRAKEYSDAGTYEIKALDKISMLMIYPDKRDYYYAHDSCYVLSFSRIWQSKCYLKNTQKEKIFYDKEIYDDIVVYLQEKFKTISFSI